MTRNVSSLKRIICLLLLSLIQCFAFSGLQNRPVCNSAKCSFKLASSVSDDSLSWGGQYSKEAQVGAKLVCDAVRLCLQVQDALAVARGDTSVGTTLEVRPPPSSEEGMKSSDTSGGGSTDIKVDGTPVTAADFAIQGYVSHALQQSELFPDDRFMGEEDATDLRLDQSLQVTALSMANRLNPALTLDDFLTAVDRGVKERSRDDTDKEERVWIMDPIDGTKGLMTGKQYIVGLALCIDGKAVVTVMGNPGVTPQVMVAVKGHGIRYWKVDGGEDSDNQCISLPRDIPNSWHLKRYDFSRLTPEGISTSSDFGWGSESETMVAGVDYPPYLLSRPMSVGSPLPFGPLCAPSEVCCGAQVKYFAVASGQVAGFIQFQETSLKSWDHAPGVLCVQESGGTCYDGEEQDIIFKNREFSVSKGIVCVAKEADEKIRQRFLACVQQTNITI